MRNKAIFLDRDGTINVDVHYIDNPDKFKMYPGVGEGVKKLKDNGFKIIVITNQSGVARGYFTEENLFKIHERMKIEFQKFNVQLDGIYYCPHHPNDNCNCRKPKTGMLEKAIEEHDIDIENSYLIGDKLLDVKAGNKLGVKTVLIPEPHVGEETLSNVKKEKINPNFIAENFMEGVKYILGN